MTNLVSHFPVPIETDKIEKGQFFTIGFHNRKWVCLCVSMHDDPGALVLASTDATEQTPFPVPLMNVSGWAQRLDGTFTLRCPQTGVPYPHDDNWGVPGCLSVTPNGDVLIRAAGRSGYGHKFFAVKDGTELSRTPEGTAHYSSWELVWEADDGAHRKPEIIASFDANLSVTTG